VDSFSSDSPSNLHRFSLCFMVYVFLRHVLTRTPQEVFILGVVRSSKSIRDHVRRHRTLNVRTRQGGMARGGPCATSACSDLVGLLVCLFFSCCVSGKILTPKKSLLHLSSVSDASARLRLQ
jgi:hypothetical protein